MVQQADAHDVAADNYNPSLVIHGILRPWMATARFSRNLGLRCTIDYDGS